MDLYLQIWLAIKIKLKSHLTYLKIKNKLLLIPTFVSLYFKFNSFCLEESMTKRVESGKVVVFFSI